MAKINRMVKQQLKMNNHRSRHIRNLKQALQQKAKIESNLRSKQETLDFIENIKSYCLYTRDVK